LRRLRAGLSPERGPATTKEFLCSLFNLPFEAARGWALAFQAHGVRYAFNLLSGNEPRLSLDHSRERFARHRRVDPFAIQSVGELSQLAECDVLVDFSLLGLVQGRARGLTVTQPNHIAI